MQKFSTGLVEFWTEATETTCTDMANIWFGKEKEMCQIFDGDIWSLFCLLLILCSPLSHLEKKRWGSLSLRLIPVFTCKHVLEKVKEENCHGLFYFLFILLGKTGGGCLHASLCKKYYYWTLNTVLAIFFVKPFLSELVYIVHKRDSVTRFFASGSFHESVSPQPQSIPLRRFGIFSKIRGGIRSSRFATAVTDTGGKWNKSSIRKILIILFGHLWVEEET